MKKDGFTRRYRRAADSAEKTIKENLLSISEGVPDKLLEPMRYALFSGGKRVRPVVVKWTAQLGHSNKLKLSRAMAAVEFVHTYSLIHDDLPAMDDDDFRRGKPSVHKKFGQSIAILAGDALLTEAFYLLGEGGWADMVRVLGECSGARGMVGGQVLDIAGGRGREEVNELKTARLFRASAVMGALAGGLQGQSVDKVSCYGINIGKAFQLKDDIMDNDSAGENRTMARARDLVEEAKKALEGMNNNRNLLELADFIITRKK